MEDRFAPCTRTRSALCSVMRVMDRVVARVGTTRPFLSARRCRHLTRRIETEAESLNNVRFNCIEKCFIAINCESGFRMYNSFERLKCLAHKFVAINCKIGFRMYNSFERLKCLPCSLNVNARHTCKFFGSEVDQFGGDVRRRFLGLF